MYGLIVHCCANEHDRAQAREQSKEREARKERERERERAKQAKEAAKAAEREVKKRLAAEKKELERQQQEQQREQEQRQQQDRQRLEAALQAEQHARRQAERRTAPPTTKELHLALMRSDVPTVKDLLARGADPDATAGDYNWSMLRWALDERDWSMRAQFVRLLLERGADPNRDYQSREKSLLLRAVNLDVVEDIDIIDGRIQRSHSSCELTRLLLDGGADSDKDAAMLLDYPEEKCHSELVQLLKTHDNLSTWTRLANQGLAWAGRYADAAKARQ